MAAEGDPEEAELIDIDGSLGSGGGQILRTSLALSSYTGRPFRLENVRADRPNPGLARQHLGCVRAAAELSGADVEGDSVGSDTVLFEPVEPENRRVEVDIGTAGSTVLLLHSVLLPATVNGAEFVVRGGTDVKWSPTWDYLENVTIPLLRRMGLEVETELQRRGHYPKGGGEVRVEVEPSSLRPLHLEERGELLEVRGVSHVSNLPDHIAERQAASAEAELAGLSVEPEIERREEPGGGRGTGITLWAVYEDTVIGGSALGERGKPAEEVGREAAKNLLREVGAEGAVDRYTGDQLLPFLSVAGGSYTATERTEHLWTNAEVCGRFVDVDIEVAGDGPVRVEVER